MSDHVVKPADESTRHDQSPLLSPFQGGGPFFRSLFRSELRADGPIRMRKVVITAAILLAWLPLPILSAFGGRLVSGSVAVPFLLDLEVHIRLLLALPLLLIAEFVMINRMAAVLPQFVTRNVVPPESRNAFEAAVAAAIRLSRSAVPEIVLLGGVYAIGILVVWRGYLSLDTTSWYAVKSTDGSELTPAGMWYRYLSLPLFQFVLFRWYFLLFVWTRFLWQVQRIKLNLIPTHPDGIGGLGFLSGAIWALSALAAAHGTILASHLATRVLFGGASLLDFKPEIAVMVTLVLCIVLGPFLMFSYQLYHARRIGLSEYGQLASGYVAAFDRKWLRGGAPADEPLMGSADIQSLADLSNSYNVIQSMRLSPITKGVVLQLVAVTILPIVPLMFTMVSAEELIKKLGAILLK